MCGFAGFWTQDARSEDRRETIEAMARTLAHRGPDDHGCWLDPASGLTLGHRRLSIIDLSAHGRQPMISADGRWVLVYNGMVYNHDAIRRDLAGRGASFRGRSDRPGAETRGAVEARSGRYLLLGLWGAGVGGLASG